MAEACQRAAKAADALKRAGADSELVEALEDATQELNAAHVKLMRHAYFGVPTGQLKLT